MANPGNSRDKKEHFNIIDDITGDGVKLAIAIGVIILIIVAVYLIMHHNKNQGGAGMGMMEYISDVSPMAPLTATPQM
jgi:hypothetical protein